MSGSNYGDLLLAIEVNLGPAARRPSYFIQTLLSEEDMVLLRYSWGTSGLIVKTHYLHLSAFTCAECNGPVVSGSVATRETEIQRESDIRQVGSICLSCGQRYSSLPTSRPVRDIAPFEWTTPGLAVKPQVSTQEAVSVMQHHVEQ